ncbi:MAG: diaminopimelate decarboxylase [Rhodospirillales bacterium]|nr:diaminopimelate decarboxylase [Rhodospirillales bacterium]
MDHFQYKDGELFAEQVAVRQIAAEVGTPCYVYSAATLVRHYQVFEQAVAALDPMICFAVKANSNIAVIATLARLGAGADVVSVGELARALKAGVAASKIIYSGVGKSESDLRTALLEGVHQINAESEAELQLLSKVAVDLGKTAQVAIRINPDVDAKTHEKITTGKAENKFGIDIALARDVFARAAKLPGLRVAGVALHIGSQLTDLTPYREAYRRAAAFVEILRADGHDITQLDLGGGLGITYNDEIAPSPAEYGKMVHEMVGHLGCKISFEPGRLIAGNAGILVSQVIFVKDGIDRKFCIVDAAMNDLIRPTLYNAYHQIVPVKEPKANAELLKMDIVGPICESGDYLAKGRDMPALGNGDLLAVRTAGAYAAVMASVYNSRPLVPEVLVSGDMYAVIRRRWTIEDMMKLETFAEWQTDKTGVAAIQTG